MDREAWRAAIHGVTKSRTRLSDWSDLIYTKLWLFHINVWQRPQHCKAIILQYKNKINNEAGTENQNEATASRIPYLSRVLWQIHCLREAFKSNQIRNNQTCIWHLRWLNCKESSCHCRRHRRCWFDPWVRKRHWRRKWQPTRAFLPGKSHGQRNLVGCIPWSHNESNTIRTKHASTRKLSTEKTCCRVKNLQGPWCCAWKRN